MGSIIDMICKISESSPLMFVSFLFLFDLKVLVNVCIYTYIRMDCFAEEVSYGNMLGKYLVLKSLNIESNSMREIRIGITTLWL